MKMIEIPGATHHFAPPKDWDEATMGPCVTLAIRLEEHNGSPFMLSAHSFDAEDIARLQAGAPMILGIRGTGHPVVFTYVDEAPQPADVEPDGTYWVLLREPGRVPERKGPFNYEWCKRFVREIIDVRPQAYITVLESDGHAGFWPHDGGDWLSMQDRRSWPKARRYFFNTAKAHGDHSIPIAPTFQRRVSQWMLDCFGADITNSKLERCYRFSEEAGELVQALGMTEQQWHDIGRYVWGRATGEPAQEVGGVMVTLAALCFASGLDMDAAAETELARILSPDVMDKIRAKHAAKVLRTPLSALPGIVDAKEVDDDAPEACPHCGGNGEVIVKLTGEDVKSPCHRCNGSGEVR